MVEEGVLGAVVVANVGRLVGAFWDYSRSRNSIRYDEGE